MWSALEIPSEQAAVEYEDRQQIMATFSHARARGGRRVPGEAPGGVRRLRMSELFDVSGKTALVTGGSRGIGLMIARGLVQRGRQGDRLLAQGRRRRRGRRRARGARRLPGDPGRRLDARGRAGARGGDPRALRRAGHPRQQRRRRVGRAAGGVPRGGWDKVAAYERRGRLSPDRRAAAARCARRRTRRTRRG